MRGRRSIGAASMLAAVAALVAPAGRGAAQSRPLVDPTATAVYERLLPQIEQIKLFDHHAHPALPDDPDVDAAPPPPGSTMLRLRDDNPELAAAAHALFGFPYADLAGPHAQWLVDRKASMRAQYPGPRYFDWVLDRIGIETSMANRVAMAPYLDPARFRWVFFADSFMFPFDNAGLASRNPDEAVYMPLQTKMLKRWERQLGVAALPGTYDQYLAFVTRALEDARRRGGVAAKFEASYFRSLAFGDPPHDEVARTYEKYRGGGIPSAAGYTGFQDAVFRHIVTEAGRLHLPVHIHSSAGGGDYFHISGVNVVNLENILRDPRYGRTVFVLIHGGYPFDREAILMASMKNVYLDSSATELMLYPTEFKGVLRRWLELYPEKITFGTDAFPFGEALGVEEAYWLGAETARTALAAALAEMVAAGEVTESRALRFAHGYLHDTAAGLYTFPAPARGR